MTKHDPWDLLNQLLSQMDGSLDRALSEAQRRFDLTADDPLPSRVIRKLATRARGRLEAFGSATDSAWIQQLVFTSVANVAVHGSLTEYRLDRQQREADLWLPRAELANLMTNVTSASIDMRVWGRSRFAGADRVGSPTEPLVMDVWCGGVASGTTSHLMREVALRWDAWLDLTSVDVPVLAACSSTSFDFADYDDQAVDELLRN